MIIYVRVPRDTYEQALKLGVPTARHVRSLMCEYLSAPVQVRPLRSECMLVPMSVAARVYLRMRDVSRKFNITPEQLVTHVCEIAQEQSPPACGTLEST